MKRVTQEDVARALGVSRTLVSYAFRGAPGVGEEMKERIFATAKLLGYRPDLVAAQLASLRSNTVGLALLDLSFEINSEIFYGLRSQAEQSGRRIVVTIGDPQGRDDQRPIDDLIDMRVDAIVLAGALLPDAVLQDYAAKLPLVVATRQVPGVDSVSVNDIAGAQLAANHLIELGHRKVAHLAAPEWYPYPARTEGYTQAMSLAGLRPHVVHAGFGEQAAAEAAAAVLDSTDRPTAVFCYNDVAAMAVMGVAAERGLRVPDDLSIVGFDDSRPASLPGVLLTSVGQQARQLGEIAGQIVDARMMDSDASLVSRQLEPTLIVRSTTTDLRQR